MHKEYRVVATLDTLHGWDNRTYHYDASTVWFNGHPKKCITTDYDKAVAFLERAKRECPKHDEETEKKFQENPINAIKRKHTNIRIESRTVSEWEVEE